MKKDEDIARAKIIAAMAGQIPPSKKRKDAERDAAIKNVIMTYKSNLEETEKDAETEDAELSDEEGTSNQWTRDNSEREKWLKSHEMILLKSIAHNTRL